MLRAAKLAGMDVDRAEIDTATGKIILIFKGAESAAPSTLFDDYMAKQNARAPQGH